MDHELRKRGTSDVTIVKLGGSYAFSPQLKNWLDTFEACAGHVVLVPGGGPFADAVRDAQQHMGFDDEAAHRMALLAMEQYGCALASRGRGLTEAASPVAIRRTLRQGKVPVWWPTRMVLEAIDIPKSWDVTADSLAAWLARMIDVRRVLLVKNIELPNPPLRIDELVARGIVDPLFARYVSMGGVEAAIAGPADHAAAAAAICSGMLPGARIDLH
jgi:5-(aminomethyl)-3-furanmethanol phosphate kinase